MSILIRAALLGGIAYLITRSLSGNTGQRRSLTSGSRRTSLMNELHPGENHIWPTSESQEQQRATASAGPSS
jgi:hypothetical protein